MYCFWAFCFPAWSFEQIFVIHYCYHKFHLSCLVLMILYIISLPFPSPGFSFIFFPPPFHKLVSSYSPFLRVEHISLFIPLMLLFLSCSYLLIWFWVSCFRNVELEGTEERLTCQQCKGCLEGPFDVNNSWCIWSKL